MPGANDIRGYPETVWKSDADGSLEHFNLWTFQQGLTKLAKLNRDVFTLTLGSRQISSSFDTIKKEEATQVQTV